MLSARVERYATPPTISRSPSLAEVIRNGYDINGFVLLEEIQDGAVEPPVRLPVEVILR